MAVVSSHFAKVNSDYECSSYLIYLRSSNAALLLRSSCSSWHICGGSRYILLYLSIHFLLLIQAQGRDAPGPGGRPDIRLPSYTLQLLLGDPEGLALARGDM